MRIFLHFLIILIILFFPSTTFSQNNEFNLDDLGKKKNVVQEVSQEDISFIIKNKKYTLFYFYTKWCSSCQETLKKTIKPLLDTIDDKNLAVVVIGVGKNIEQIEERINKYEINYATYFLKSPKGAPTDAKTINTTLSGILNDYSPVDFVPNIILCRKDGKIIAGPDYNFEDFISFYFDIINKKK